VERGEKTRRNKKEKIYGGKKILTNLGFSREKM